MFFFFFLIIAAFNHRSCSAVSHPETMIALLSAIVCFYHRYLGHHSLNSDNFPNFHPELFETILPLMCFSCAHGIDIIRLSRLSFSFYLFIFCRKAKAVLDHPEPAPGWGLPAYPLEKRCHASHTMTKDQTVHLRVVLKPVACVLDSHMFLT